jgi:pimeloyl-ACP methyl ester carboxylesterase
MPTRFDGRSPVNGLAIYIHRVRRLVAALVPALILLASCGSGSGFSADPPDGSREVAIDTPDGEKLEATVAGDGPLGVIVAHGSNATRENWFDAGGKIAAAGDFTVVMLNLRGYEGSTGIKRTNQDVDILAAMDWLSAEPGIESVSFIGSSMGATSVLDAAGQRPDTVRSVVALSPPQQSASMDAAAAVPNLTMPLLLLVAEGDKVFVESTTALGDALGMEPTITNGSGHGTGMFADNPELINEIIEFLRT